MKHCLKKLLFCLAEMQEIDCYQTTNQMAGMCVVEVDAVVTDVVIGIAIMEWNGIECYEKPHTRDREHPKASAAFHESDPRSGIRGMSDVVKCVTVRPYRQPLHKCQQAISSGLRLYLLLLGPQQVLRPT